MSAFGLPSLLFIVTAFACTAAWFFYEARVYADEPSHKWLPLAGLPFALAGLLLGDGLVGGFGVLLIVTGGALSKIWRQANAHDDRIT